MDYYYEAITTDDTAPMKVFIHSVKELQMHFHREMELLMVLKGSVNVKVGPDEYVLRENDVILINANEIHSTSKTKEENILLALQLDVNQYEKYYPGLEGKAFNCKSFLHKDQQEKYDMVRYYLAKIVWNLVKSKNKNMFTLGSDILLFGDYIINNFEEVQPEEQTMRNVGKNIQRLVNMVNYIDENIEKGVTLKDVANNEELSMYYTSHFLKKHMGMSFQEYVNIKRLEKAKTLLRSSDKTITDIAFESGYPSAKALNSMFNKVYGFPPSHYRQKSSIEERNTRDLDIVRQKSKTYLDVDRTKAFSRLFQYLDYFDEGEQRNHVVNKSKRTIVIDATKQGVANDYYWRNLTTFGRAAEGLRSQWRSQLREIQGEIGFKYIRFHGIFSDEMMVLNYDGEGNIIYNWSYVDELFDFFKEVGIKPFIELGFMPSEIGESDETMFWWKANISQPKEISLWTDMVKEFAKHIINRYGKEEVESWYFEVWNEPELEHVFWVGGKEEYFKFYEETAIALKSISQKLKVGGPSITHQALKDSTWLEDYLNYVESKNVPLDFVSLHIYPEKFSQEEEMSELLEGLKNGTEILQTMMKYNTMNTIYFDENHTFNTLSSIDERIKSHLSKELEVHITEWSASSNGRNLINDTSFIGTYIVRNVLKSLGQAKSLGYWTFTDIMEEMKAGISHFHGGFGLINKEGIKKPSYYAYYLLSKLGEEIIDKGDEYIVTKSPNGIQILAYNFSYFDELFLSGDTSALMEKERYSVFEDKKTIDLEIALEGVSGNYKMTRYELNREHGSAFDKWVEMGTPQNMTREEINYLKGKAQPRMTIEYLDLSGKQKIYSHIPTHGVELISLERQF
ncbi:MAG: helix-turn-helix domain-containing protein [Tissierellaceae bacterium]|nr:helix-turn-helix domain-containing protein [Tissierellaceae bacterium]